MNGNDLAFQYFLGDESEQFSFIKVPKIFFTDKRFECLSYGAKILYGLLLDRMNLSRKNRWYDGQRRVYVVYAIESIREDFSVSKSVAVKFMRELEDFGLIEKKRRPNAAAMIYVKNFILQEMPEGKRRIPQNSGSLHNGLPETQNMEVQNMEVQNMDFQKNAEISGSPESGLPKNRLPEVQKMESNKTDKNKTEILYISSSVSVDDMGRMIEKRIHYQEIIATGYDSRMAGHMVKSLAALLCIQKAKQKINIHNRDIPIGQVKEKVWDNLTNKNFKRILENILAHGADTVYNLQNYIVACFYNLVNLEDADGWQKKRGFHDFDFEQNPYDFEKLEERLSAVQMEEQGG